MPSLHWLLPNVLGQPVQTLKQRAEFFLASAMESTIRQNTPDLAEPLRLIFLYWDGEADTTRPLRL